MAGCAGDGAEMRQSFSVRVLHDNKPLADVTVRIAKTGEGGDEKFFVGTTDSNGLVRITNLPPGNYWIYTDLLGISAGMQCFHVAEHRTSKALKSLKYDWGDMAPATKRVHGTLVDSQPGQIGTPLERLVHRVNVPIPNAKLTLHDVRGGSAMATFTDVNGYFSYPDIPKGTYVLHIDSGVAPGDREYDASDILIDLAYKARLDTLRLVRREASGGSCGGTSLELQ